MSYRCAVCGNVHEGLSDIGFRWPDHYFAVPENERSKRIQGTTDTCVIDNEDYFIRGVILIPVHVHEHDFGIGVWVTQKRENFETYVNNPDSDNIGPFFGWLSNTIPCYEEDTLLLKTRAHFQGTGSRPLIEPGPCEHPLYRDFARGITLHHAFELMHCFDNYPS